LGVGHPESDHKIGEALQLKMSTSLSCDREPCRGALRLRSLLLRIWNSPTYTTWGSLLANSVSAVVVLPLVLTKFSPEEIVLWYLMLTFLGLQYVVDIGFSPTFSRVVAYLMGGVAVDELRRPSTSGTGTLNHGDLNRVYSTMRTVYSALGLAWTMLLLLVGTLALYRPIANAQDPRSAWIAWAVIIGVSYTSFWGEQYVSYLMGLNQVALLRRWDTIAAIGSIASSFLVLYWGGGLLSLIIANQTWQLLRVARNRWLARSALSGLLRSVSREPFSRDIFNSIWPSVWRSGIGVAMSYGVIQSSGIIYSQVGTTANVASYLLGMRFMQILTQVSGAPFNSKIPVYSRLYAEGKQTELLQIAERGMRLSHWVYVLGFGGLAFLIEPILRYIGSHVAFPNPILWTLMGLAFFAERFGAMHIQLYSTTNHITWHVANGVSGVIYLAVSLGLFGLIGAYAFPVGIIAGYYGFYSWYAARQSYKAFGLTPLTFERSSSIAPATVLIVLLVGVLLR
jgi:O-antigen/teichoic acid export membrane protein